MCLMRKIGHSEVLRKRLGTFDVSKAAILLRDGPQEKGRR